MSRPKYCTTKYCTMHSLSPTYIDMGQGLIMDGAQCRLE